MANFDINQIQMQIKQFFYNIQKYWEENKEWLQTPLIINGSIMLLSILLVFLLGSSVGILIKIFVILLFIGFIVGGFYSGEQLDPVMEPVIEKINEFIAMIKAKLQKS